MRSDPTILVRHGQIDVAAAHRERVTDQEIVSAVHAAGGDRVTDARFVFLEPDGRLTAIVRKA
jgi:uncharacterized membrane protein YcaP (DUF421 family)